MEIIDASCKGCGSCCEDVKLPLTALEARYLHGAGTALIEILPPLVADEVDEDGSVDRVPFDWSKNTAMIRKPVDTEPVDEEEIAFWDRIADQVETLSPGEGYYMILGRCAFLLNDNSCGGYEERPRICRDFNAGGDSCNTIRLHYGKTPIVLTKKPSELNQAD